MSKISSSASFPDLSHLWLQPWSHHLPGARNLEVHLILFQPSPNLLPSPQVKPSASGSAAPPSKSVLMQSPRPALSSPLLLVHLSDLAQVLVKVKKWRGGQGFWCTQDSSFWSGAWIGPCALPVPQWSAGGAPAPRNPCTQLQVGAGSLCSLSRSGPTQLVWLVWVWTARLSWTGMRACGCGLGCFRCGCWVCACGLEGACAAGGGVRWGEGLGISCFMGCGGGVLGSWSTSPPPGLE